MCCTIGLGASFIDPVQETLANWLSNGTRTLNSESTLARLQKWLNNIRVAEPIRITDQTRSQVTKL